MNSSRLEEKYIAALSKMERAQEPAKAKRHIPIFQRNSSATKKQAISDAAAALGALWMADKSKHITKTVSVFARW